MTEKIVTKVAYLPGLAVGLLEELVLRIDASVEIANEGSGLFTITGSESDLAAVFAEATPLTRGIAHLYADPVSAAFSLTAP